MPDILAEIIAHKRLEITARMQNAPIERLREQAKSMPPPKSFLAALQGGEKFPVIAEIKRRSPSKGLLCENFSPADIASAYATNNAACLSVLTDEKFFGGCTEDLQTAAAASGLPVLRKDFMLTEWQIIESRAMGADAILLIAAVLAEADLRSLAKAANDWKMTVLVETHTADEARIAAGLADVMIGINNRNLKTFQTDLQTTLDLLPLIKEANGSQIVVSESGIHRQEDIKLLQEAGVDAFLIGEALVQQPTALRKLFS